MDIETTPTTEAPVEERRQFLATAGKLAAVLGVLGLTSEAWAQKDSSAKMVLEEAVRSGDVKAAIAQHGKELQPAERKALESLSTSDLKQMKSLQSKLGALRGAAGDGNGIF